MELEYEKLLVALMLGDFDRAEEKKRKIVALLDGKIAKAKSLVER